MIGGNIDGTIQIMTTTKNSIGESVETWSAVQSIHGWLDMSTGDTNIRTYNSRIEESTHVFIMDYVELNPSITCENSRMIIKGKKYEITYIDDPMELHKQLEIFMRMVGGQ